jgi:hypothetical protein
MTATEIFLAFVVANAIVGFNLAALAKRMKLLRKAKARLRCYSVRWALAWQLRQQHSLRTAAFTALVTPKPKCSQPMGLLWV